ncbi:dual specificity phosphatase catalytic domain protein [Penicillium taxi]|uniref:dual specificity phosphatase catalytic domain protein n=1 Tax=Penicillium taxi TaxID=168475 RepID=UPI0025457016|nr:dual specificity phosphatase catalytic domain protein [Penicillium taxi]KAJ5907800.1 dual specificity phosphatase catalytic domain protein [Penicillium taxi]
MKSIFWALSTLLALEAKAATLPSFPSACANDIQHDVIYIFSHAPLTFSFDVFTASDCATKCAGLSACCTWLYSTSGYECQLYGEDPISEISNPLFVSGACSPPTASLIGIPSSSSIPILNATGDITRKERKKKGEMAFTARMRQIVPGLFLGNVGASHKREMLQENHINAIVSLTDARWCGRRPLQERRAFQNIVANGFSVWIRRPKTSLAHMSDICDFIDQTASPALSSLLYFLFSYSKWLYESYRKYSSRLFG